MRTPERQLLLNPQRRRSLATCARRTCATIFLELGAPAGRSSYRITTIRAAAHAALEAEVLYNGST